MKLFLQGDRTDKTKKEAGFIHNRDLKLQHNVFGENLQQSNYAAALQPIGLQRSVVDSRLQVHVSGLFLARPMKFHSLPSSVFVKDGKWNARDIFEASNQFFAMYL